MGFPALLAEIRSVATAYPEAYEERPWGELAVKVRKKAFAFLSASDTGMSITTKLPESRQAALALPWCEPTHYGLGKHGWVTARFADPADVDVPTVLGWLEESYRSVAPKTLAKAVPAGGPVPGAEVPLPAVPDAAPGVVVVSDDPLRAERAVRGLAERGLRGLRASTADLDDLADVDAAVIVVDLGRSASIALGLAGQLALLHFDCPLVLAGIRDSRAEEAARAGVPGAALLSREPPGDAAVLDQVAALLS
ncbi:MAG: MmcQ/YjbR family DNA-binding protein [Alphaproteobacteria bacterium]|nr:MmcQ/YjbR family DNA-binding protein [Alphaproteobacteria bacterium]